MIFWWFYVNNIQASSLKFFVGCHTLISSTPKPHKRRTDQLQASVCFWFWRSASGTRRAVLRPCENLRGNVSVHVESSVFGMCRGWHEEWTDQAKGSFHDKGEAIDPSCVFNICMATFLPVDCTCPRLMNKQNHRHIHAWTVNNISSPARLSSLHHCQTLLATCVWCLFQGPWRVDVDFSPFDQFSQRDMGASNGASL